MRILAYAKIMPKTKAALKFYSSYGLNIKSFIHLPNLLSSQCSSDVIIRKGCVKKTNFYQGFKQEKIVSVGGVLTVRPAEKVFALEWKNLGACLIENGSDVSVELDAGARRQEIAPLLTGPVLAVLLHQRKHLVLHASAVKINGRAAVFLGNKGFGKSTLAAHLRSRGHTLISDDLVPVYFSRGMAETIPGHPQICLFADSAASVGLNTENLPTVNSWTTKKRVSAGVGFSTEPVKLGGVFVLNKTDRVELSAANSLSAFIELARNSYMHRYLAQTENTCLHFEQCRRLLETVPIFNLNRPHDYGCMPRVSEMIENCLAEAAP